jgi:hypothetical protein
MDNMKSTPGPCRHHTSPFSKKKSTSRAPSSSRGPLLSLQEKDNEQPGGRRSKPSISQPAPSSGSPCPASIIRCSLPPPSPRKTPHHHRPAFLQAPLPAAVAVAVAVRSSGRTLPSSRHGSRPLLRHRQEGQGSGRALVFHLFLFLGLSLFRISGVLLGMDVVVSSLVICTGVTLFSDVFVCWIRRSPEQGLPYGPEVYPHYLQLQWNREYPWFLLALNGFSRYSWFACYDC